MPFERAPMRKVLLAFDEAVVKQAMDGRAAHAAARLPPLDGQQLAPGMLGLRLTAWDLPVAAQLPTRPTSKRWPYAVVRP